MHEKGLEYWISHLYDACNGDILSRRALTVVLEDRIGTTRNELRELTSLKWFH